LEGLSELKNLGRSGILFQMRWLPVAGSCEHGNESSVAIEDGEFIEKLSNYWFLKQDSKRWNLLLEDACLF
jgi:hypothetical protein